MAAADVGRLGTSMAQPDGLPEENGVLLVGRDDVRNAVLSGPHNGLHDIVGSAGSGKSSLLMWLNTELNKRGTTVVYVSGSRIPGTRVPTCGTSSVSAERTALFGCAEAVQLMAYDLARREGARGTGAQQAGRAADRLNAAVRKAFRIVDMPPVDADTVFEGTATPSGPAEGAGPGLRDAAHGADPGSEDANRMRAWTAEVRSRLRDEVIAALTADAGAEFRLAVLVDEFDQIERTSVGDWVLSFIGSLTSALRVIARRRPGTALPGALQHELGPLNPEDVADYLRRRLGPAGYETAVSRLDMVVEATGGNPSSVAIATDLLAGLGPETDLPSIPGGDVTDRAAADCSLDLLCGALDALIEREWQQETGGDAPLALGLLNSLGVVRHFDMALLATLLADTVGREDEVLGVMLLLIGKSFVIGFDDDDDAGLRLHSSVGEDRERRLAARDPVLHQQLHVRMQHHYEALMDGFNTDPELDTQFRSWHRYEDPAWRRLSREWLFHSSRANTWPHEVRLAFARLFLDAFFWFGFYIPFSFCDEILEEFADPARQSDPEDREWLFHLSRFYHRYPRRREEDATASQAWCEVRTSLAFLLERAEAGQIVTARARADLLQIRGHLNMYLGVATQRDPSAADAAVEQHFADAIRAFTARSEDWCVLWAEYRRAEYWCRSGQFDRAEAEVPYLERRTQQHLDFEIRALLTRLLGDVRRARGDLRGAGDAYARAALHAYVFQIRQETDDQAPTEYTTRLYADMLAHNQRHLAALREGTAAEQAEYSRTVARIHGLFAPYWTNRTVATEASVRADPRYGAFPPRTFPPLPLAADLDTTLSAYADDVRHFLRARYFEIDNTPITVSLPDATATT
jgi:hypothetical protein